MQTVPSLDLFYVGFLGLIIGLFTGYILGQIDTISTSYRIIIGIFVNVVGGIILALLLSVSIYMLDSLGFVFVIFSTLGGFFLGLFLNWKSSIPALQKSHIIYESEDYDEEFDRQIKEALGEKE